jgi:hypothetical protein
MALFVNIACLILKYLHNRILCRLSRIRVPSPAPVLYSTNSAGQLLFWIAHSELLTLVDYAYSGGDGTLGIDGGQSIYGGDGGSHQYAA